MGKKTIKPGINNCDNGIVSTVLGITKSPAYYDRLVEIIQINSCDPQGGFIPPSGSGEKDKQKVITDLPMPTTPVAKFTCLRPIFLVSFFKTKFRLRMS